MSKERGLKVSDKAAMFNTSSESYSVPGGLASTCCACKSIADVVLGRIQVSGCQYSTVRVGRGGWWVQGTVSSKAVVSNTNKY